jgi:hypothetical protein
MARVSHRSGAYPSPVTPNDRTSTWPTVMPYARGMQPPPNEPWKLRREWNRLHQAICVLLNRRADLAVLLDRKDRKLADLRRQREEIGFVLQDLSPEMWERCEEDLAHHRNDPIAALKWALQRVEDSDV